MWKVKRWKGGMREIKRMEGCKDGKMRIGKDDELRKQKDREI